VVAVILAYNAAGLLEKAYRKIPRDCVDEVIVMDDASTDATVAVARRHGLAVYQNPRNLGYGGNVREGLRRALRDHAADYVVEVHGDGAQFDPAATALAVPLMNSGVAFIMGSRFIEAGAARRGGMPWVRLAANRALSALARLVLRLPLTEYHSGFRIYSRRFIDALPLAANSAGHLFSFQILAQAAYFRQSVAEIPVDADYRSEHQSIPLGQAAVYAVRNLGCLTRYLLASAGLRHSATFPRRRA
jgi:glycosyltransferase involved in cell wall biosynthesis